MIFVLLIDNEYAVDYITMSTNQTVAWSFDGYYNITFFLAYIEAFVNRWGQFNCWWHVKLWTCYCWACILTFKDEKQLAAENAQPSFQNLWVGVLWVMNQISHIPADIQGTAPTKLILKTIFTSGSLYLLSHALIPPPHKPATSCHPLWPCAHLIYGTSGTLHRYGGLTLLDISLGWSYPSGLQCFSHWGPLPLSARRMSRRNPCNTSWYPIMKSPKYF